MIRFIAACLAVILTSVSTASPSVETRYMQGLGDTHYHKIDSVIIGRSYHLFVMLPDGYEHAAEKDYPTIYLLDGGRLFPLLSAYYRYLNFEGEIPDSIIVGISYGTDRYEDGNYRSTDYTAKSADREYWGGAAQFQRFLSEELLPLVEKSYRSRADRRVIFGQSIGGQFVLYTAQTRPDLFWGHIASNPALHRNLPFFLSSRKDVQDVGKRSRLFVASAANDEPRFRVPALEWIKHWSNETDHPWQLKTMILEGHTHMSAPPASFRAGTAWIFSEY